MLLDMPKQHFCLFFLFLLGRKVSCRILPLQNLRWVDLDFCNKKHKKKKKLNFKIWMLASRAQTRLTEVQLTPFGLEPAFPLPGSYWLSVKRKKYTHIYFNIAIFSFIFIITIRFQVERKVVQRAKDSSETRWSHTKQRKEKKKKDWKKTNMWCTNKENEKHRHKIRYVPHYQCSWLLFACLDYC